MRKIIKLFLLLLFSSFLVANIIEAKQVQLSPENVDCNTERYDFNNDGRVSAGDLNYLLDSWKIKQPITQSYIGAYKTIPNKAYANYLESLISNKSNESTILINDNIISDLGYKFSICSKGYLFDDKPAGDYTLTGEYLKTGEDYAGRWYQFGSSSEYGEGYLPDFSFKVTLSELEPN